jgi:hypothetical protein
VSTDHLEITGREVHLLSAPQPANPVNRRFEARQRTGLASQREKRSVADANAQGKPAARDLVHCGGSRSGDRRMAGSRVGYRSAEHKPGVPPAARVR